MNPQNPSSAGILISIQGIGHVPSFKNSKLLTRGKLITDPKKQEWMKAAQDRIASELLFAYPTSEHETVTAAKLRSWIASSLPADDSCRYLIACSWSFMNVPKGKEGALIQIERQANIK